MSFFFTEKNSIDPVTGNYGIYLFMHLHNLSNKKHEIDRIKHTMAGAARRDELQ